MRVLLLQTYYPEFLDELYAHNPGLSEMDYDGQLSRIFAEAFGIGDSYSAGLRALGCEAVEVITNADVAQMAWATERGISLSDDRHERRRQIVAAQVEHFRPEVLIVFEWCPLGDAFLSEIKSKVRLLVGQISSPLPANRTFGSYDLMLSSWPPIVEYFRGIGMDAEPLKLAFDERILDRLPARSPEYDVTFVGGFGPAHTDRIPWLERLLEHIEIDIFGYGLDRVPSTSPIHGCFRGPAWGWRMYEILQTSRVTLNLHARIDVRGSVARNVAASMRLYEATGVGTCLVTEWKDNLAEMFEPGQEVVAYTGADDCVEKIRGCLSRESERSRIAEAGQRRTLSEHTFSSRTGELLDLLRGRV